MKRFKFLLAIAPGAILLFSMAQPTTPPGGTQQCLRGSTKSCILSPYGESCVSTSTIKTCAGTITVEVPTPIAD